MQEEKTTKDRGNYWFYENKNNSWSYVEIKYTTITAEWEGKTGFNGLKILKLSGEFKDANFGLQKLSKLLWVSFKE